MSLSRRVFLRAASVLGLSAVIPGGLKSIAFGQQAGASSAGFQIPAEALESRLAQIDRETFAQTLNTTYRFVVDGRKIKMSLIRVIDLRAAGVKENGGESFSLIFRGPFEGALPQGTYSVKHDRFGKISLFIVPGDKTGADGLHYEATFNRLAQ